MINKILDIYFVKKLKKYIQNYCLKWVIDTRFVEDKWNIILQVKRPHYKEECYSNIFSFQKVDTFIYLLNLKAIEKEIDTRIKNYSERNKYKL